MSKTIGVIIQALFCQKTQKRADFFPLLSTLAENHRHLHVREKELATKIRANFSRFARIQKKWEKSLTLYLLLFDEKVLH